MNLLLEWETTTYTRCSVLIDAWIKSERPLHCHWPFHTMHGTQQLYPFSLDTGYRKCANGEGQTVVTFSALSTGLLLLPLSLLLLLQCSASSFLNIVCPCIWHIRAACSLFNWCSLVMRSVLAYVGRITV